MFITINQHYVYNKEGFDIRLEANTDLKGGIIPSEAEKDKNKISTGTLTYEDIKNEADYKAGGAGINIDTSPGAEKKDAGVTPNIGVGALGAIAGEIVSGNAQAGASGAISTERDNHLPHEEQEKFVQDIRKARTNAKKFDVIEKYYKISEEYRAKDPDGAEVMEQQLMDELAKLTKYDDAGKSFELTLNKDLGLHENLRLAKEFLGLSKVLSNALPNTAKDLVIMASEESITSANILRGSKVQIIDIAGNIVKEYDSKNLPEETMKMIVQEAGKGFAIYTAGEYAKVKDFLKV